MERERLAATVALLAAAIWALYHLVVVLHLVRLGFPAGQQARSSLQLLPSLLPALAAAVLLWRGRRLLGAAVLGTAALMHLPMAVSTLTTFRSSLGGATLGFALLWIGAFGLLVVATLIAAAGAPRPLRRPSHPGVLAAIGLALTGTVWPVISSQVPIEEFGALAWSRPLAMTAGDPWVAAVYLLSIAVHAAVLLSAASVEHRVGTVIVLAAVVPWLASDLGNAIEAARQPELFFTPAGWASVVGQVVLLVIAAAWWRHGRAAPVPPPTPDHATTP